MQINWEKNKSYAKTAWKYYAKWAYLRRHLKLFALYLTTIGGITYGISGFRISISHNPNTDSFFEITKGDIGWPEVCIIFFVTIAFIFIGCLMEWKLYLTQADADYKKELDAMYDRIMDPFCKMFGFIKAFDDKGPFVNSDNEQIKHVFDSLNDIITGQINNLYISAFSGMGKTRWICEAFKDVKPGALVYYCDKVDEARFDTSFSALIKEYVGKEAIIILDDCDADIYDNCLLKIQQSKCNIKLIGLNNDTSNTPTGDLY